MTTSPHQPGRLDLVVARGFLWTSGGRFVVQLATWVISLAIARLLTPRDYGIAGMAYLYVGFAQMLAELGIGAVIVQRQELSRQTIAALTGASLVAGVLLAVVSVPAGFGLAAFYREPVLVQVVAVYGLSFIPTAFRSISAAILSRRMAFERITILALLESVAASLTSLVLALNGWSVWALVLGNTAGICLATVVAVWWAPPGLSLNLSSLRGTGTLTFGSKILVSRAAWYAYASADFLVIGRRIGAKAYGEYQLAHQFASIPADRITGALTQVLFPVLSNLQQDPAERARYFRTSTEACVLVLMPVYVGLALVAHDFVAVALGARWASAAPILAILSLVAVVRSTTAVANSVILSAGNASFPARLSLIGLIVFPPAFYLAAPWGAAAVAAVWLVLNPVVITVPSLIVALRASSLRFADWYAAIRPYVMATLVMAAAAFATQQITGDRSALTRLALTVGVGAATYAGVLALFCRDRIQKYVALAGRALSPASNV